MKHDLHRRNRTPKQRRQITTLELPMQEEEKANEDQVISENKVKERQTRSEIWETEPMRRSEWIQDQEVSSTVLVTKTVNKGPSLEIKIPRTYLNTIKSSKGKFWKDAMDYESDKLEEMNTWDKIDSNNITDDDQILPGISGWVI